MLRLFRVIVEFPALDRLMDYLGNGQQGEIDALTEQVTRLTVRLAVSEAGLAVATKEQHAN